MATIITVAWIARLTDVPRLAARRVRCARQMISAPKTPSAAASDGDAMPP